MAHTEWICKNCKKTLLNVIENRCTKCNSTGTLEYKGNVDEKKKKAERLLGTKLYKLIGWIDDTEASMPEGMD